MKRLPERFPETHGATPEIHLGIVTALPVECAAVQMLIDDLHELPTRSDPNHYRSGSLPSKDPDRPHRVVLALQTQDGTRNAASICTDMARSFPRLREFIMCGIAGAVPTPDRQIRLGDVVAATGGVVDYDHVRTVDGTDTLRRPAEGLSKTMLRADRELEVKALMGSDPWRAVLETVATTAEHFRRPPSETDVLRLADRLASDNCGNRVAVQSQYRSRVHRGAVGSADRLLRDAERRDTLMRRYGVIAVEMEGSGIAAGADLHDRRWFMIRGITDYCDNDTKSDLWHGYAALAAAAYVRALLAECDPIDSVWSGHTTTMTGLQAIVDALLGIPQMRDDYQRRAILAQLPISIRTTIPDSVVGRLHIVELVHTCQRFANGQGALLSALQSAFGADSPDYRQIEAVIVEHWPDSLR